MTVWIVVLAIGAATFALKAAGPLLLARRPLGERALRVPIVPAMAIAAGVTALLRAVG
jgi:hypothetical protein